jgi:hypothetical protein
MRSAKMSTVPTRRAKRPDGRLLRDMRKRHHSGRRGGKSVWIAGLILLAILGALAWHWLQ